jgi:hypothetical protein
VHELTTDEVDRRTDALLEEAEAHFMGEGGVRNAAAAIAERLAEAGVDYAIAGETYRVVSLPRLVEMKLASGMTAPHRLQDLADVLRLILAADLPRDFAAQIDPYVRAKFDELWLASRHPEDDY